MPSTELNAILARIAAALEKLPPPSPVAPAFDNAGAFVWKPDRTFRAVHTVSRLPLSMLKAIDPMRDALLSNTVRFAQGYPANNALLWGARGMGKSSLVKAVHAEAATVAPQGLKLIEIHRDDLQSLPHCLDFLREAKHRFILFCDDLSFETGDAAYKALKSVLDGGIEGRPANVVFYATSNRRHLMPRKTIENETADAIHGSEAADEKVALSDRFGLWLGFHVCSQAEYLDMVESYAANLSLPVAKDKVRIEALAWAMARGARSGRVAVQFVDDLAGRVAFEQRTSEEETAIG